MKKEGVSYTMMKSEHINPFLTATKTVIEMVTSVPLTMGKPFVKKNPVTLNHVILIVGMTGDLKGQVIISFQESTAKSIASAMMMGMPIETLDEMSKSALGELANMVLGNVATALSKIGVSTDITPPNLLVGDSMEVSSSVKENISIPFSSDIGEILLDIAIKYTGEENAES